MSQPHFCIGSEQYSPDLSIDRLLNQIHTNSTLSQVAFSEEKSSDRRRLRTNPIANRKQVLRSTTHHTFSHAKTTRLNSPQAAMCQLLLTVFSSCPPSHSTSTATYVHEQAIYCADQRIKEKRVAGPCPSCSPKKGKGKGELGKSGYRLK